MTEPRVKPYDPPEKWPTWIRPDEVAIILGRSLRTVRRMVRRGDLKVDGPGGLPLISKRQLMPKRVPGGTP